MKNVNVLPGMHHYWDAEDQIALPNLKDTQKLAKELSTVVFDKVMNLGNEYYVLGEGGSNHWLRFCLSNQTDTDQELVLATSPAVLAEVDFYPQKDGTQSFQTGSARPFDTRDIYGPEFHFSISLLAGEKQEFYLRVNSRTNAYITASVWHKPAYLIAKDKIEGIDGLLAGILLGLILYTMLLYFSVRQSSSLLYILWSTSTLILFASIDGRVLQFLLPNSPSLAYFVNVLFYPLSVILTALFAQQFLGLKEYPRLYLGGQILIACFMVLLGIIYQFGLAIYFQINGLFAFAVVLYFGLLTPLYGLITKGSVQAKYLLIAQFPLIICVLDRSLLTANITSEHYVPYSPKFGLVAEMILLAYCIGLVIYKEKSEAQKVALEQLTLSNELKTNYNSELEAEIERNTAEIRDMNTDLEQKAEQLIQTNEAKSQFFANISHEFRTPLTLIQGPLMSLLDKTHKVKDSDKVIRGAIRHSKTLQGLIDQLLTLSKFDAGSLSLQATQINITDATRTITAQFDSLALSKEITLEFQTNAPSISAFVDQDKLQIMLNNLLSNAIKFTDSGGRILVEVSSSVETDNDNGQSDHASDEYVRINVSDTGYGIPSDELELVFDRFFQSRTSVYAGSGSGTGIGLALVKELANLHAGEVTVSSVHPSANSGNTVNAETGTCFTITLPLGSAHLKANEIIQHPSEVVGDLISVDATLIDNTSELKDGSHSAINGRHNAINDSHDAINRSRTEQPKSQPAKPATILVVDDNDDMRAYIRSVLEPEYSILEAVDGLDAEVVLAKAKVDLVVTDLMMPKRDGLELVKSLKANGDFDKIPVIMLTAKAGLDNRLKGLIAAVDDYLAKPFDARELKVCIKNLLTKQAQLSAFYQSPMANSQSINEAQDDVVDDEYLTRLRSIIDRRLSEPGFGVNELAQDMNVSKATLSRHLTAKYNFTPSEYIRQCRLEKARQLSLSGEIRTLGELASMVGFNQAGYFSRLYQKTFNSSPLEKH